jgi:hypothetical protein
MRNKRLAFINAYLKTWNATSAAREAGYKQPHSQGSRLLENVEVKDAIRARLADITMDTDEILVRLTEQARGEAGQYIGPDGEFDFAGLIEAGKQHLIKSVTITTTKEGGSRRVEFYSAQDALRDLARHYKLFADEGRIMPTEISVTFKRSLEQTLDFIYSTHPAGEEPKNENNPLPG